MSNGIIERVARAIDPSAWRTNDRPDVLDVVGLENRLFIAQCIADSLTKARAAILAMREPTDGMVLERYGANDSAEGHDCRAIWQLMIDAALKESE